MPPTTVTESEDPRSSTAHVALLGWAGDAIAGMRAAGRSFLSVVPPGYSSCFDPVLWTVRDHPGFVRRFYATFHLDWNDGHPPVHAVPVGIAVTDDRARLLGLHAVSIVRVAPDPDGEVRVYFYNPNNEGRQDWGEGVVPTVRGNGEQEGESSLPFGQFASRLYAFHHPADLPGDPLAVDAAVVDTVSTAARRSWGRSYSWT